MNLLAPVALIAGLTLVATGIALDRAMPLVQSALFVALQGASLMGAGIGLALAVRLAGAAARPLGFALLALLSWRLAYFPIMVFSGHVASIGEWLLALSGLPIFVYPVFLLSVAALHAVAAVAISTLLAPPHPLLRWAVAPAFVVATLVSFNQLEDLRPLPDTVVQIDPSEVPPMRLEQGNPYLSALVGEGYLPNQRVVLVAAGLTYDTIPPSPWATAVKAVLEGLFLDKPFGSTRDRVLEHYLAYHAAHPRIGCRQESDCPIEPEPAGSASP